MTNAEIIKEAKRQIAWPQYKRSFMIVTIACFGVMLLAVTLIFFATSAQGFSTGIALSLLLLMFALRSHLRCSREGMRRLGEAIREIRANEPSPPCDA